MKFEQSIEGTYDEAVEASAERILFITRDSSASSGYSSDAEASQAQEGLEACSVDGSRTSSSLNGYSTSKTEEDEQDDIQSEILFLQEKQSLLKRAISALKREGAYEASRARETADGKFERQASSLWDEAREIIELLDRSDGDASLSKAGKRCAEQNVETTTTKKKRRTNSIIDTTSVVCISSASFCDDKRKKGRTCTPCKRAFPKTSFVVNGPWMGQALARNVPSFTVSGWEVLHDPDCGLLVVPPALEEVQNGVELKDALALTSNAQLVTLSAPPFYVVHANKAFCTFSGLSSEDIIGKPVESLLLKVGLIGDQDTSSSSSSLSSLTAATGCAGALNDSTSFTVAKRPCHLQVAPITDKFRQDPSGGSSMSHLLVKVQARDATAETPGCDGSSSRLPPSQQNHLRIHHGGHHRVLGAVG